MAPGGYTPTAYNSDTFGAATSVTIDFGYYATDTTYTSALSDDWESAAKVARKAWLFFTRGLGWTDGSPLMQRVGVAVIHGTRKIPCRRQPRRLPRCVHFHTLKQLRRLGVI